MPGSDIERVGRPSPRFCSPERGTASLLLGCPNKRSEAMLSTDFLRSACAADAEVDPPSCAVCSAQVKRRRHRSERHRSSGRMLGCYKMPALEKSASQSLVRRYYQPRLCHRPIRRVTPKIWPCGAAVMTKDEEKKMPVRVPLLEVR